MFSTLSPLNPKARLVNGSSRLRRGPSAIVCVRSQTLGDISRAAAFPIATAMCKAQPLAARDDRLVCTFTRLAWPEGKFAARRGHKTRHKAHVAASRWPLRERHPRKPPPVAIISHQRAAVVRHDSSSSSPISSTLPGFRRRTRRTCRMRDGSAPCAGGTAVRAKQSHWRAE